MNKDIPEIIDNAVNEVDGIHKKLEILYKERTRNNLLVKWNSESKFRAYATSNLRTYEHTIHLTYDVPIEIYNEAKDLVDYSNLLLSSELFQNNIKEGDFFTSNYRKIGTLPKDIDLDKAVDDIFKYSLWWLFFHESAHLLQNHGAIRSRLLGEIEEYDFSIDETETVKIDSEKDALIYHILEISADNEATLFSINNILLENNKFTENDLWFLSVGITCLFYKFSTNINNNISEVGSHPDPSIRITFVLNNIIKILTHESARNFIEFSIDKKKIEDIISHACNTVLLYWQLRHNKTDDFPIIFQKITEEGKISSTYMEKLMRVWLEIKPSIEKEYIGINPLLGDI